MRMELYVDGSYSKSEPDVTKGAAIILVDGKPVVCQQFKTKEESLVKNWNVGGELVAAMGGIIQAGTISGLFGGDVDLHVYYDYMGVEKFATGEWQAKKLGPKMYVQMVKAFKAENKKVHIHWHKVKAHSGSQWNEAADKLANGITPKECSGCRLPDIDEIFGEQEVSA